MSNQFFKFKQFTIFHDRCGMKVGTDGVLLGAWARVDGARRLLDVGAGSGLIAIQMAQRNPVAEVEAVEIDAQAAAQAEENAARSPWAGMVVIVALLVAVVVFMVKSRRACRVAFGCFVPYLLWLAFAAYLNAYVCLYN